MRRLSGISRNELAAMANVGITTLAKLEHGADPHLSTAYKLAHALRAPVTILFSPPKENRVE
jgi:transcriptional regulator with XRE-family HTH domain